MPIYEYTCDNCGNEFELLVSSGSKPACVKCNSKKLTKKFSTFAAHQGSPASSPCSQGACPSALSGACPGGSGGHCPF